MQNFALLAILSSLILFTIFATESFGYTKMSVEGIFRLYVKANLSRCRRKSAKITRPLTLNLLLEKCAEEMNNERITISCSSLEAARRSEELNITSTQILYLQRWCRSQGKNDICFHCEISYEKTNSPLRCHYLGSRGQKISRQQNVISRQRNCN